MLGSLYRKMLELLRSTEAVCAKPWKCMRCGGAGTDGQH